MLIDKIKDYKIILASKSPRRRELMAGAGLKFTLADDYDVEEVYPDTLEAEKVPRFLARLKSEEYPKQLETKEILITADTVVIAGGEILGKPTDRKDAMRMLKKLSGAKHTVVTGVMIRSAERSEEFSAQSDVWFRELRDAEIEYYIDNYKPYDKAGAYGIQEWIGYTTIERIEGSFYNVMGLPIQKLYKNLEIFISK